MRRGAFSLIETVIALFLFTAGAILIAGLFHMSLRYSSRVEDRLLAVLVAEKSLAEVREWAAQGSGQLNFNGSWALYDGTTRTDADYPRYQVSFAVADQQLTSPSTQFESGLPAAQQNTLASSAKRVSVRVRWDDGDITLATLMEEPPRNWRATNPLVLSASIPDPVTSTDTVSFSVEAFDDQDELLQDLDFVWYVEPLTSSGSLDYSGNGESALFSPVIRKADGTTEPSPTGMCRVKVKAIYRKEERWGTSATINIQ